MQADPYPMLFSGYAYGASKSAIIEKSSATPCPDAPQNALLLCAPEPVEFLRFEWRENFVFNNLDELQQIILSRHSLDAGRISQLRDSLLDEGWMPLYFETDADAFDFLEAYKGKGKEEASKELAAFERKASGDNGSVSIYFCKGLYWHKFLEAKNVRNYPQATTYAGDKLVIMCLMSSGDYIKLAFGSPELSRKNALRYGQYIKR